MANKEFTNPLTVQKWSYKTMGKDFDDVQKFLETHNRVLGLFKGFWDRRTVLVKRLVNDKDIEATRLLLILNTQELRLLKLLDDSWIEQKTALRKLYNYTPNELLPAYDKLMDMATAWHGVISIHKNFLEIEQRCIPNFLPKKLSAFSASKKARIEYFKSLDSALSIYSQIIVKHDQYKIVGKEIFDIAKKKLDTLPGRTQASFTYGWYRILGATLVSLIFGESLPGGNASAFILWSLHVNIAGTILSFIDLHFHTAYVIKDSIDELIFILKPSLKWTDSIKNLFNPVTIKSRLAFSQ